MKNPLNLELFKSGVESVLNRCYNYAEAIEKRSHFKRSQSPVFSLTRKTDYALVAMAELMRCQKAGCDVVSAREIADRYQLPQQLLMNILKDLCNAELVQSIRGANGGYKLAVQPADVTLLQVVEVIEGPLRLVPCADEGEADKKSEACGCQVAGDCLVQHSLQKLHNRIVDFLEDMTLAELVDSASLERQQTVALTTSTSA